MTVREKAELIVKDIKKEQGTNPVVIFKQIAEKEYISIHGPDFGCREQCVVYGEYAEQSHPLALHLQSSTEQVRFQQMEHGEIICSLPRKQSEN